MSKNDGVQIGKAVDKGNCYLLLVEKDGEWIFRIKVDGELEINEKYEPKIAGTEGAKVFWESFQKQFAWGLKKYLIEKYPGQVSRTSSWSFV